MPAVRQGAHPGAHPGCPPRVPTIIWAYGHRVGHTWGIYSAVTQLCCGASLHYVGCRQLQEFVADSLYWNEWLASPQTGKSTPHLTPRNVCRNTNEPQVLSLGTPDRLDLHVCVGVDAGRMQHFTAACFLALDCAGPWCGSTCLT